MYFTLAGWLVNEVKHTAHQQDQNKKLKLKQHKRQSNNLFVDFYHTLNSIWDPCPRGGYPLCPQVKASLTAAETAAAGGGSPPTREVVAACGEDLGAPAGAEREQTRTKVARRVHGIARVHAEGHAQSHDHEAEGEGRAHGTRRAVALVRDGVDAEHEHGRADELGVEGRVVGDVGARIRGEAALRRLAVRVDDVQVLVLHDVDDEGAAEGAQQLRQHVAGRLPPRQTAVHAVRERDGSVEVGAAHALGAVDADEHADAPAHVDAEPRAVGVLRVGHLVVHAHAEDDHDEGAEELGQALAHVHTLSSSDYNDESSPRYHLAITFSPTSSTKKRYTLNARATTSARENSKAWP
ncbi:hypothetical protein ON010_g12497 [Phytophthora cinnamomi]|nr:hypothetical protein ON010_g12497 [Phytophthora cinnamomi]